MYAIRSYYALLATNAFLEICTQCRPTFVIYNKNKSIKLVTILVSPVDRFSGFGNLKGFLLSLAIITSPFYLLQFSNNSNIIARNNLKSTPFEENLYLFIFFYILAQIVFNIIVQNASYSQAFRLYNSVKRLESV